MDADRRCPDRRGGPPGRLHPINHAHVLLCIARDPRTRLRDVAESVGMSERATQRIVSDLVDAGYLHRQRDGRRNVYRVDPELPLRHPLEPGHAVGEIIGLLLPAGAATT